MSNCFYSDNANFINFCSGKTLTNGLQQKKGSCNGIGKSSQSPQACILCILTISK